MAFDPAGSLFDFEGGEDFDPDQGGLASLFEDTPVNPLSLLSGGTSFQGGDAGPATSEATSSAETLQASPFNFSTGGTPVERTINSIMPLILAGVVVWMVLK